MKKHTCSMQKKKESISAKKNEDNGKEYITEWQADIIKGLEKVKDKYGLVIEYNGPFSDEWKEYPTYSVSVRKGGKKENIGTVGTDYVHAFVEYINPGMNVSHPHKAKDYSAEEAIQVILNSANMCLGKKGESKKPTCSMQKKKESLAKKNEAYSDYDAIREWLEGVMEKAGTMFESAHVSENRPGEICAEIYGYDSTGGDAMFTLVWHAEEDFAETISAMADELVEFAEDFDPDEEAKLYSDSGMAGVPSLRQLLKAMDERKEDMVSLAGAVSLAASKL
ncbi:MAG: hypothetical protein IK038_02350 [Bacteroidaceae bacterium]|nr:hypothetical protein [Bacteroidaceae bacterium]